MDPLTMTNQTHPPMNAESLLKHASWAHSLARGLVGEGAAEDLVQETWVAALQAKPEERHSLRPWLGTVLGNFARQGWRGSAHRQRRELVAAKHESLPSAAELTERTESQRLLMEQLLKLPEAQRELLLLKYFEELSAAEIGRRRGLPVSTVKSRIERGLEALRKGLDEQYDGGREIWGLALMPLLRVQGTRKVAHTSGATGFGWMSFTKLSLWLLMSVAGASALLVIGQGVWSALPFQESVLIEKVDFTPLPLTDLADITDLQRPTTSSQRTAIGAPEEGEGVLSVPALPLSETTLRVRFLDSVGQPVPGVRLGFGSMPPSDGAGRIEHTLKYYGQKPRPLSTTYSHRSLAGNRLSFTPDPGGIVDLGDVITVPGGALRGRVVDGSGEPLPNAEVSVDGALRTTVRAGSRMRSNELTTLGAAETSTDENGEFRLTGLIAGDQRVEVSTRDGLHQGMSGRVEIRVGQETSGLVIHAPAIPDHLRIEGHVFDPDGNPTRAGFNGSYRVFLGGGGSFSSQCDADGFFRIILRKEVEHDLVFSAPRSEDWAPIILNDVSPGSLDMRLQFKRSPSFQLLATDEEDGPLAQYSCTILDGSEQNVLQHTQLGPVGAGGLNLRLPEDDFVIRVRAPGFAEESYVMAGGHLKANGSFSVALEALPGIRGHVLYQGQPVAWAKVYLQRKARQANTYNGFPARFESRELHSTVTGMDGSFELELDEDGEYAVRASAEGFAACELASGELSMRQGVRDLKLHLSKGGSIHGKVFVDPGRSPARTIVGISRGDCWAQTQMVGPDGLFRFESLTPGPWMVKTVAREIDEDEYESISKFGSVHENVPSNCRVVEGQETRFDVLLAELPLCTLQGQFKLAGIDMSEWLCEIAPTKSSIEQRGTSQTSFRLDSDGRFELRVAGDGKWELLFMELEGANLRFVAPLQLREGQNSWKESLDVAWISFRGLASTHEIFSWEGERDLLAIAALPKELAQQSNWQLVPSGKSRIAIQDSARALSEGLDPSDPSTWKTWKELDLQSGQRLVLDLDH